MVQSGLNDGNHFIMRLEYPAVEYETAADAIERFGVDVVPELQ